MRGNVGSQNIHAFAHISPTFYQSQTHTHMQTHTVHKLVPIAVHIFYSYISAYLPVKETLQCCSENRLTSSVAMLRINLTSEFVVNDIAELLSQYNAPPVIALLQLNVADVMLS